MTFVSSQASCYPSIILLDKTFLLLLLLLLLLFLFFYCLFSFFAAVVVVVLFFSEASRCSCVCFFVLVIYVCVCCSLQASSPIGVSRETYIWGASDERSEPRDDWGGAGRRRALLLPPLPESSPGLLRSSQTADSGHIESQENKSFVFAR